MPENMPNTPGGALPPKPAEASKVQPKKETVRINLPPKPTSAPTIKLPTLAPGAPMPSATSAAAPAAAPRSAAPPAPPAPPPTRAGAPSMVRPSAAPAPAPRPSPYPQAAAGVGKLDKALAVAAALFSLAAIGTSLFLVFGIPGITRE